MIWVTPSCTWAPIAFRPGPGLPLGWVPGGSGDAFVYQLHGLFPSEGRRGLRVVNVSSPWASVRGRGRHVCMKAAGTRWTHGVWCTLMRRMLLTGEGCAGGVLHHRTCRGAGTPSDVSSGEVTLEPHCLMAGGGGGGHLLHGLFPSNTKLPHTVCLRGVVSCVGLLYPPTPISPHPPSPISLPSHSPDPPSQPQPLQGEGHGSALRWAGLVCWEPP